MRKASWAILACAALAAAACGAVAVHLDGSDDPATEMQKALEDLRTGRHEAAEQRATILASDPDAPMPRAWLIAAQARQQRGRFASAILAYQLFLASCSSTDTRDYVTAQIAACRASLSPEPARTAPGKRLTGEQLDALARVDPQTYTESSQHFVVRARNPELAKLVAVEAEQGLERICHVILPHQEYAHSVDIYVWTDRADYGAHASDSPHMAGGCFSIVYHEGKVTRRIDLTQLDADGRFATVTLDRVLPHEMCHLVLQEFFGQADCPLFLNEGLAMLAEWETDNDRVVLAGTALAGEAKVPLGELFVRQRHDMGRAAVFYAESFSFTEYLHGRMSRRQFKDFLAHVKSGCTVRDALHRALYISPDEKFVAALASAWEDHAVAQAQYIRALAGGGGLGRLLSAN